MNSMNDIWTEILKILSKKLTPTAINTWFSECKVVDLTDCNLVISAPNEFKKNIISQRFSESIRECLSDIFSCPFDLQVILEEDIQEYQDNIKDEKDPLPEMVGYTFDRFIVGKSNQFAHAAAKAVAENPGKTYNPLFIYGNSGLGKTHLLMAIGQEIRTKNPSVKITYIKGDDFMNEMVKSIRENSTEEFRTKYRNSDLFLVDDIQFIAGKQQTQNEFFHTFNSIYEAGHQIVITSDRPPKEMATLEDRLVSRFEGGLLADIQPPDLETRMAITRNKAAQLGLVISDEAVEYIAANVKANIRQLEGVIKRITAYKDILNQVITLDVVKDIIKNVEPSDNIPNPEKIMREVARYYSLREEEMKSESRSKNVAMARQVAMYEMRALTNMSLNDIGKQFGKNHSTVLSSIKKIEELMSSDSSVSAVIRDITSNINSN
ncbi:MAG: chromosomal replication initiator protein DnaA [Oscillospiraceae bacterium]|nr:chromosomal replication initiator protein DnaA [Oscillospiraceae bacterium]